MQMQFYWIMDRVQQGQFLIYWRPGIENLANYLTRHHPTQHHKKWSYKFLEEAKGKHRKNISGYALA